MIKENRRCLQNLDKNAIFSRYIKITYYVNFHLK